MKRLFSTLVVVMMLLCCTSMIAFGAPDGNSLDDVINGNTSSQSSENQQGTAGNEDKKTDKDREQKNKDFIAGLNDAADLSGEVEGVSEVTAGIKLVASWIVQVLSYAITALLALRVVLDLAYIGLPFTRHFLSNGHMGNAQAGAGGMPNSAMGGMQGGMGMGGMGGMGGYGINRGMGGMGMGGYGMNRGMGMGGMQGGMQGGEQGMATGRVQWVSNAALNAVAGETSVSPDGRAVGPFKHYCKDMIVVLVLVPILITLAVTGTLTNLGFLIGDLIVDAIAGIGDMI